MRGKPPLALTDDQRKQAIGSLKRYFEEELEHEIGDLKATLLLDYIMAEIGPVAYNRAMTDARAFIAERAADLEALEHDEFRYWAKQKPR